MGGTFDPFKLLKLNVCFPAKADIIPTTLPRQKDEILDVAVAGLRQCGLVLEFTDREIGNVGQHAIHKEEPIIIEIIEEGEHHRVFFAQVAVLDLDEQIGAVCLDSLLSTSQYSEFVTLSIDFDEADFA